jgi:hypothetical protein
MSELMIALISVAIVISFLAWFWLAPGGVLDLRRLANGEIQVDVRSTYSPDKLYGLLDNYGEAGRQSFRRNLLVDMVFPAVFVLAIWSVANLLHGGNEAVPIAVMIVKGTAIAAACFDYGENILLLRILQVFPVRSDFSARSASLCTSMKGLSYVLTIVALIAAKIQGR